MNPDARPAPIGGTVTFGGRKGRMGPMRQRALAEIVPGLLADVSTVRGVSDRRLIVEIGCGKGDATLAMAGAGDRDALVVACEANAAALASVAMAIHERDVANVRLWLGDALALLPQLGQASVDEVRIWFPDPWPKPRHAAKRMVTAERVALITDSMVAGGLLRLATDHADYAAQALDTLRGEPRLDVRIVERPAERPITAFEARGLREGRNVVDVEARRVA